MKRIRNILFGWTNYFLDSYIRPGNIIGYSNGKIHVFEPIDTNYADVSDIFENMPYHESYRHHWNIREKEFAEIIERYANNHKLQAEKIDCHDSSATWAYRIVAGKIKNSS